MPLALPLRSCGRGSTAPAGISRLHGTGFEVMTSFFVVPTFVPLTLEQLPVEPDEVSIITAQEAKISQELAEVREYNRDAEPLGVIAAQEELESEGDGLTSDEDLTEEEEEEEEEADELGDIDDGDFDEQV